MGKLGGWQKNKQYENVKATKCYEMIACQRRSYPIS